MNSQRELEEAYSLAESSRITDRKKGLEKIIDMLTNDNNAVIQCINGGNPISWNMLLEASQNCLRKECEKIAETAAKKSTSKGVDKNFELSSELFTIVIKTAFQEGLENIKISKLIKYIAGCLKEKKMKICRNKFLCTLKEYILPNNSCLGYFDQEDFNLLFQLLKQELNHCTYPKSNDMIVFSCFMLLVKHGPLYSFSSNFLRGQFSFISTLCQSITKDDPRPLQLDILDIMLDFCKHTVEDNRSSCVKLGEEVFFTLLDLYVSSGHDSEFKVKFVEFCLLQMTIHNPNGVSQGDPQAFASNWTTWKNCIKKMYILLNQEIQSYLRHSVKNTLFFVHDKNSTVILDTFVMLFVNVTKQMFSDMSSPIICTNLESFDCETQPQKRKKVEATLDSYISEIQETKSWVWIKLTGALLAKYPHLVDERNFISLLQILRSLQLEEKDSNVTSYVYECQAVLLDAERNLNIIQKKKVQDLWKLIGESTLMAVGLNQNIKEAQLLLQKLIDRNLIDLESVIQKFTLGVLTITKHHLKTVNIAFRQINFSQLENAKRKNILNNLLNLNNVKDCTCFLEVDFAKVLVTLVLKQCPESQTTEIDNLTDLYQSLIKLYSQTNFDIKKIIISESVNEDEMSNRSYNIDKDMVENLLQKVRQFVDNSYSEPLKKVLCVIGLLYNLLNYFIKYNVLEMNQLEDCEIVAMIRHIINNEHLTTSLLKYQTHNEKALKTLLDLASILDVIFSMKNCVTDTVKNLFPLKFFKALFEIVNFFQDVTKRKAELEHEVKVALMRALSKYCLVSTLNNISQCQKDLMMVLANPDYDFKNDTDYSLSLTFLNSINCANPGFLPEEAVSKILHCLHDLCSARYRSYEGASAILHILKDLYLHLNQITNANHRKTAIDLLQPFYLRLAYYGPDIAIDILSCIESLCQVDPNCQYSKWDNKEIIKYVPSFLSNEQQKVRYKAIEVLVKFFQTASSTVKLEDLHRLEELFAVIYDENLKVFEVEGEFTEERRYDEVVFRCSSALHMFVSLIVNCHSWIEESLFTIIRIEHQKKLSGILSGDLLSRAISSLKTYFDCEEFLNNYLEILLTKWISSGYDIGEFPFKLFDCSDKLDFYIHYFDVCVPLLFRKDRNDLFRVAKQLNLSEKDVLEKSCTKIFGKALSHDIKNVGTKFFQNNVEMSQIYHILGSKLKEILMENIDEVMLSLLDVVTDEELIYEKFEETVLFFSKGISYNDFKICLKSIENLLFDGKNIVKILNSTNFKIQKVLLELELKIYKTMVQERLKRFYQYSIFVDLVAANFEGCGNLKVFFLRDTIHFLIHLTKNNLKNEKLSKVAIKYIDLYLRKILPDYAKEFEDFVIFTINSLKNFALFHDHLAAICIQILEFIIIDNVSPLVEAIVKLDDFPNKLEFKKIKTVHNNIKNAGKRISLEDEISSFLNYNDISTRQDSLVHLKNILTNEKEQLRNMYENLYQLRGFSEDCEKSLLHRLICMLVKMSCFPNTSISLEAIKCLGELGPANLTTLVLEPEKKILDVKCTTLELITGHVVSLLIQYIIDSDVNVVETSSKALYAVAKSKEGKKVIESGNDFGYGIIKQGYITPYLNHSKRNASQVQPHFTTFSSLINNSEIWYPSNNIDNNKWLTSLVLSLLETFQEDSYLKRLVPVCRVKVKFCEHILQLLIYLLLSLKVEWIINILSKQINGFFECHWNLTVESLTDKDLIPVNKKSVKCMLDVINFVRHQSSFSQSFSFETLKLNYLAISKAAGFCSAHFTAVLYAELWCRERLSSLEEANPQNENSVESGYNLLDLIYENVGDQVGLTLQNILQSAYQAIGDLDALSGCGLTFLLQPEYRADYYKNLGKWDKAMNYYLIQPVKSSDEHLIESFKMNQFYGLCSSLSVEPEYECLWRLGHWKTNKKNALKYEEISPDKYEKYKFHSIKALCENDQYTCSKSKEQLSLCVIDNLKNISLESSKNIYPIMAQLQSLVEMDDFIEAVDKENFAGMFQKWRKQDAIIKRNDFNFIEPVIAQRITILRECVKKYPQIREQFFEMVLNFADYAKEEHHIKIAESAIINIRNLANVHSDMKNELQFREAQLAWLDNEKMITMQLLRKLCKEENITPRLKASVMKLQGEYMAEMYSDRKTIVNSFTGSIRLLQNISNNLTPVDRRNLEDIYDKMATFADREYQQIMVHMKSDSFQKKVSNMKLSKEMAISIVSQKRKTVDERKAAVLHEKQCQIDQTEINTVRKDKDNVLCLAIKYYVKNLSLCDTNNIKIFRVMSLLLENRDNDCLARDIKQFLSDIPTYKYITMLPQLIPHISMNNSDFFCDQINNIVEKCALDHPHHTLPLLLALINAYEDQKYDNSKTKKSSNDRIDTAKSMINKLLKAEKLTQMIRKMQTLSEALIELAYFSDRSDNEPNKAFNIPGKLKIHRIKDFDDILVPTCTLSVSKTNSYDKIVGIVKFMPTYKTVGGINAPKRIECLCTEGKSHSQLVKGKDDLRQDAVMQQVFKIMTDLLSSNMQTKNLLIRTYKIVPLSMRSGILKWVDNSMPIGNYLVGNKEENYIGAHSQFRPNDMRPNECRAKFKKCATCKTNDEKLTIYNDICKNFKPVFHKFFETYFPQPSVWYERRRAYIYSVATTSMCGYILGIGDRHVSNILIDKQTAEVIHIDFGIAFEQGKCLPTPETIPFRLTRDLVDGMGVSGVEGLFRKSCEKTVEVLRTNAQTILTTLEVLLYDPLYVWTLTSAEANKRQTEESVAHVADEQEEENKNVSAERALLRLKAKLQGTEEGKPTSIEQQVGTLIKQAMDPGNLCRLFCGWQPYL